MPVPNIFANVTTAIPLSQLDNNFATAITMGNTAVQLGNTITTMNNMTFPNVTISSVATTFPNSYLANSSATLGNATITLGGTTSSVGNLAVANVTVTDYTESQVNIGNSSTTQTISLSNGTVQTVTLTANCTFTMPSAVAGKSFLVLIKSGAGNFTGTFTGVKWPANTAPTITSTASRLDIIAFSSDGTNWYGTTSQNYYV